MKHLKPWMEMAGSDFYHTLYHTTSSPFVAAFLPSVSEGFPKRGGPRNWIPIFWLREKFSEASFSSCPVFTRPKHRMTSSFFARKPPRKHLPARIFSYWFWSCLRCHIHVCYLVKVKNRIQKWWLFVLQKSCSRYWVVVIYFGGCI